MTMFEQITLNGSTIRPALFCAPMAGITNSAFRRLIADFGGYGALFTEMLSGRSLLHEKCDTSPFTKRRECEKTVFYQLLLNGDEDIGAIISRIAPLHPDGIDINLGCPAPSVRMRQGGFRLFQEHDKLEAVLDALRTHWQGILTIKCRLGADPQNWQPSFIEKCRLFEKYHIDALIVHPRFSTEKLKRRARWEYFSWITEQTPIPVIGSGDILSADQLTTHQTLLAPCAGMMLGRIAVVKPWIFREIASAQTAEPMEPINYAHVWETFYTYVLEDFPREKAIGRLKEFTAYYARNFFFGHELYRKAQGASSLEALFTSAMTFLNANPRISTSISVSGI